MPFVALVSCQYRKERASFTLKKTIIREWFGRDDNKKKLWLQILYNDVNNRMDICLRCPETKVGIEFSFKPESPVPDVPELFWYRLTIRDRVCSLESHHDGPVGAIDDRKQTTRVETHCRAFRNRNRLRRGKV